ncbi:MAG: phosphoenolpyruvate carboxykinase (ATP), partial [Candidatus Acidiferrales bacterium]
MGTIGWNPSHYGLENHGLRDVTAYWNLPAASLYEHAVRRNEGLVSEHGALVCRTGDHTGRSPNDKFLVKEPSSDNHIWWGDINRPFEPERFDSLHHHLGAYLQGKELYVQDCFAGAEPEFRLPIRVITQLAWHSLFARNLFIRPDAA